MSTPQSIHSSISPAVKKVECKSCGLADICIPHGLSNDELDHLDSITKEKRRMERNDALFHAGDSLSKLYAVKTGSFKTTIVDNEGSEQITGFYLPGEILGLDGMGGRDTRTTAVALESSSICEIAMHDFDRLAESNKGLRMSLMNLMGEEISRDQEMMLTLGQMDAEAKLANFLMGLAHRYKARGFSATEFNLSMSRHDIANFLGLAVETLSRLFKKFQENNLLAVNKRNIQITDWHGLCKVAHGNCEERG